MVFDYIYSAIAQMFSGSTECDDNDNSPSQDNNDLTSSCIIGKSLTPNVMVPIPKNTVLTNTKN